jgi:hypothetical protein
MFGTTAAIFSLLLILTGIAKIRSPNEVARALGALGLPGGSLLGVAIGAVEVIVGVSALFFELALAVQGVVYVAFSIWIVVALRSDAPLASCGCLGRPDTPPTVAHLVMNLLAAVFSFGAAVTGPIELGGGLEGAAALTVVAVGVYLAYIVLTDGARLVGVRAR